MKHRDNPLEDQEAPEEEQPLDDGGGEGDMDLDPEKQEQKQDDNVESSSTGSDGGKGGGSGSGGGYSADCSSSDGSSLEAAKGNSTSIQMSGLSLSDNVSSDKIDKESKPGKAKTKTKSNKGGAMKPPKASRLAAEAGESSLSPSLGKQEHSHGSVATGESSQIDHDESPSLPQWNGIRVSHPMDPRIDLSIVNHVQTSSVPGFPTNVDVPAHHQMAKHPHGSDQNRTSATSDIPNPSIDQYMSLMEVVHPFFHAYSMSNTFPLPRSDEPSNERPSSNYSTEPSDSDHKPRADHQKLGVPVAAWNTSRAPSATAAVAAAAAAYSKEEQTESDSSSLVVLARVKRKHMKKPPEESIDNGNNAMNNDEANTSSSSEKKVRIQQPQQAADDGAKEDSVAMDLEDDADENDIAPDGENENDAAEAANQQESTSASSSEERNNGEAPQNAPLRYGVPAVVSEYSSSARAGSSGASNTNLMSTSGSGSGENNGTGSGSGSNQGGSSGSGNDQGGSSGNGTGSSGSGNDVKGSSGENNSADASGGNSDESNSNKDGNKATTSGAAAAADPPHVGAGHRHGPAAAEDGSRDNGHHPLPLPAHDGDDDAAREKKLQDKKRKRMNMRREYEEKVQQEMESSEGSRHRAENLIRPGRPITLDKVLSFTKVARIVIKAGPPFLVVHTNAAYSRLSGIDSHFAVGKPISALLSIPDQDVLAEAASLENSTMAHEKSPEKESKDQNDTPRFDTQNGGDDGGGHTYVAAEAAGRARAAASQEDITDMCLERLVAASGFGRFHLIHVLAKPHHMVGRNVTVKKPAGGGQEMRGAEERSNNSSISSGFEGAYQMVTCSMGVSPVVSSPEVFNAAVVTDKDQDTHHHKAKRRKHHHHGDSQQSASGHHQHRRNFLMREVSMNRKRHLITHYVIQLEPFEGTLRRNLGSQSSTSTTVEAHIMGLTKSELRSQRMTHQAGTAPPPEGHDHPQDDAGDNDELGSESSGEPREPVTAIG